jgi:ABC-type transport system involved in cytochrome c biogenesis permease subunit
MKRWFPWIMLILVALFVALGWIPSHRQTQQSFNLEKFGEIPVLVGGRIQPIDSVARNSLLIMHGKQRIRTENGDETSAIQWMADLVFNPAVADACPTFLITNPDVLGLFGWQQQTGRKYYSFNEIAPYAALIDTQAGNAEKVDSSQRSPYQTAVVNLRNSAMIYQRIMNSFSPATATDFMAEIQLFKSVAGPGMRAAQLRQAGEVHDEAALSTLAGLVDRYRSFGQIAYIQTTPPPEGEHWLPLGDSILRILAGDELHPLSAKYIAMGDAYRAGDASAFNQQIGAAMDWMRSRRPAELIKAHREAIFNHLQPFYQSMILYLLAFLFACASWLWWPRTLSRTALLLLIAGLGIHTFGLVFRMYLQGRPPVTNLYSSAIFIGWGTVLFGIIFERIFRDGLAAACSALIGFVTLIIAQHLAESGDTMEMLRAVLDTNIWLATHVVIITLGYSAMFFAGMLAIIYVVRGVFTKSLDSVTAKTLTRMTYGVLCFATLFSFVGTVLGGIWADQSWGRFWGWDPKENGALLIVLWCAIILHARWGGYIRQRGLMVMAIFGNVVTSFSWFGVNMLGVGLHSYGFMDKAFPWLAGFMLSQLFLMGIGGLPLEVWRSFAKPAEVPVPTGTKANA